MPRTLQSLHAPVTYVHHTVTLQDDLADLAHTFHADTLNLQSLGREVVTTTLWLNPALRPETPRVHAARES